MSNSARLSRCGSCAKSRIAATGRPSGLSVSDEHVVNRAIPLLLFTLVVFSAPNLFAQSASAADSTLAAIKGMYDSGSYISAELQTRRVLEDKRVNDTMRVQLEKYLGFALVAQGKNESAEEHFINALRLDSSLTLDPVLTSPKILSVFEAAKAQYQAELSAGQSKTHGRPKGLSTVSRGPSFRSVLFPGWEQLYRGKRTKGYILLGVGAAAAVTAIVSDFLRRDARTNYLNASTPALAESRYHTYDLYYKTEVYSISAFVLIYAYSELDAFLDLPPNLDAAYSPSTRSLSLGLHLNF